MLGKNYYKAIQTQASTCWKKAEQPKVRKFSGHGGEIPNHFLPYLTSRFPELSYLLQDVLTKNISLISLKLLWYFFLSNTSIYIAVCSPLWSKDRICYNTSHQYYRVYFVNVPICLWFYFVPDIRLHAYFICKDRKKACLLLANRTNVIFPNID